MYYFISILFTVICVDAKLRIYVTDTPIQRIGSRLYKVDVLTENFKDPKELAYDSSSRNLYFMYMDDVLQDSGRAKINIITKEEIKIKGIKGNKATAVDEESGEVYFGSDDGLYKYDPVENKASNIGLYNMNIFKLVVRSNYMYLVDANNHMLYKIFDQGATAMKIGHMKTIVEFEVDYNRNIHLVTMCGVYCVYGGIEVIKNKDLSIVYHFISDEHTTFGVTEDGLYEIDCFNGTANRVANLNFFPKSITFGDYGDIFYTTDDKIIRLKPLNSYTVYNIHRNNNN